MHRFRNQTRLSIPLASVARAWTPKTAILFTDVEPIYRSDKGNISPLRLRVGLGYIASPQAARRVPVLCAVDPSAGRRPRARTTSGA